MKLDETAARGSSCHSESFPPHQRLLHTICVIFIYKVRKNIQADHSAFVFPLLALSSRQKRCSKTKRNAQTSMALWLMPVISSSKSQLPAMAAPDTYSPVPVVWYSLVAPGVNPSTVKDDDPRLVDLNPSLDLRIRNKSKEVFVEEELARRRQVALFRHSVPLCKRLYRFRLCSHQQSAKATIRQRRRRSREKGSRDPRQEA